MKAITLLFLIGKLLLSNAAPYSSDRNYRTNFCERLQQVENREILIENALRGLNISVAIYNEPTPPLSVAVRVLEEISWRAQFDWRHSYGIASYPSANQTWTDVLLDNSERYDIVVDWWARTIERLNNGILFTETWYDADTIIVRKTPEHSKQFNPWALTLPFTPALWWLIFLTLILSGAMQYFLEYLTYRSGRSEMDKSFLACIFFSFHVFTGHCNNNPKSNATRMHTVSLCFLSLVLIASFTANLANFFIRESSSAVVINDINDVVYNNLLVCSQRAIVLTENFKRKYPRARLLEFDTTEEVFLKTSEGECDVCLTTMENFKTYKRDMNYNKYCDLVWEGRRVETTPASFALANSGEYCASLLHSVVSLHMLQMKNDGTLEKIWSTYRDTQMPNTCTALEVKDEDDSNGRLTVVHMSGVFIFHLILMILSLILGFNEYKRQPKDIKNRIKDDISTGRIFHLSTSDLDDSKTGTGGTRELPRTKIIRGKRGFLKKEIIETMSSKEDFLSEFDDEFQPRRVEISTTDIESIDIPKEEERENFVEQNIELLFTLEEKMKQKMEMTMKEFQSDIEELKNRIRSSRYP